MRLRDRIRSVVSFLLRPRLFHRATFLIAAVAKRDAADSLASVARGTPTHTFFLLLFVSFRIRHAPRRSRTLRHYYIDTIIGRRGGLLLEK
jgi:hypothetical protein